MTFKCKIFVSLIFNTIFTGFIFCLWAIGKLSCYISPFFVRNIYLCDSQYTWWFLLETYCFLFVIFYIIIISGWKDIFKENK